jgi:RNA polymerase primary sigma factor
MNDNFDDLGAYLKSISKYKPLPREREVELFRDYREGDESAGKELVNSNLLFVVSIAREYTTYGLTLPELISEGNFGLIEAANRFDETRGFKFITYAVWWIRQSILKGLSESGIMTLPINSNAEFSQISRDSERLSQLIGREATLEEITSSTGRTVEDIEGKISREQTRVPFSLDHPCYEDEAKTFLDILPDENCENAEREAMMDQYREFLMEYMDDRLDDREQKILNLYFGLDGEKSLTLEEIGRIFKLTRERIRQVRDKALIKLNHSPNRRILEEMYEEVKT